MSEINSIANGSFVLGQTSATNFVAGPGIKVDSPSAGTVRIGNDETVLWSGNSNTWNGTSLTLSESLFHFDRIRVVYSPWGAADSNHITEFVPRTSVPYTMALAGAFIDSYNWNSAATPYLFKSSLHWNSAADTMVLDKNWILNHTITAWSERNDGRMYEVIGINRISGSNA